MIRHFKVILMSLKGLKEHFVNCNDDISAKYIAGAIFPKMRVIEVIEIFP